MRAQYYLLLVIASVSHSLELQNLLASTSTVHQSPVSATHSLLAPLIIQDGRFVACSGKNLFAFDRNGSAIWVIPLNYFCREDVAPVTDDRGKIYLAAESKILKINPSKIGTTQSPTKIFYAHNSTKDSSEEIIGISISTSYSSLFFTIRNRGIFSFLIRGEIQWSVGPVLYRLGYRIGCYRNTSDCYFNSPPVVDQCEGTLYVSNTEGQLYSLYIRNPDFRWIQDLSSFDRLMIITSGNNGLVYVTFPRKALIIGLDAYTGNISWQNTVGPLSSERTSPVVDSNGWLSIGSSDGTLYSISPDGDLRKLLDSTASDSVIQTSPVLDCSGFAVYISQTVMDSKLSHTIGDYTYISAMRPLSILFTLLAPATGTVYWTGKYTGEISDLLSKSDLQYFAVDERIILTFLSAGGIGNVLPCYSTRQRIAWTCSQAKPKFVNTNSGDDNTILVFIWIQFVILVILAIVVRFCCIFWRKAKLQDNGLSGFLEKRRSLHSKKKRLSKKISELEQKSIGDATANKTLDRLDQIVKRKEGIERKLSSSYSLGRDGVSSTKRGSILPLYKGKTKSYSFQDSRHRQNVILFNTLSDDSFSSQETDQSASESISGDSSSSWREMKEIEMEAMESKQEEAGPSRIAEREGESANTEKSRVFWNPIYSENEMCRGRRIMCLKRRRTLSSTN